MWTKLDDGFLDHPKVAAIGPLGIALHVSGMVYCGRQLTDGYVAASIVPRLCDFSMVAELADGEHPMGDVQVAAFRVNGWSIAKTLVVCEVWHDAESVKDCPACRIFWPNGARDGYYIHDYLVYNLPRSKVLADRESAKARRNGTRASGERRASVDDPVPAPVPAPEETKIKTLADSLSANGEMNDIAWLEANGLNATQNHFLAKIVKDGSEVKEWAQAVNTAKKRYRSAVVTTALSHLAEYDGPWDNPYGALLAECQRVDAA